MVPSDRGPPTLSLNNMDKTRISVGIDPGWVNCGVAVVSEEPNFRIKKLASLVINPSKGDLELVKDLPKTLEELAGFDKSTHHIEYIVAERYVPYNNLFGTETENITMVIGMLRQMFYTEYGVKAGLVRAIEWKVKLAQVMSKHAGFNNPSIGLDKKFSCAIANFMLRSPHTKDSKNEDPKIHFDTDHEADALCLAGLPFMVRQAYGSSKISN